MTTITLVLWGTWDYSKQDQITNIYLQALKDATEIFGAFDFRLRVKFTNNTPNPPQDMQAYTKPCLILYDSKVPVEYVPSGHNVGGLTYPDGWGWASILSPRLTDMSKVRHELRHLAAQLAGCRNWGVIGHTTEKCER